MMKKKILSVAASVCAAALLLGGCSREISNEYVKISQYKGVEVQKVTVTEVTDETVESQIQTMLEANAETIEITDRAAQDGDTVTIDYEGKKDGVAFDGGTSTDYPLTLGSDTFIDGFEDGIVGHKTGETFDLNLTFPEEYSVNTDLAGQDVVFTVTIKSITQSEVPELNDEFVQKVSEESKTVEEYKKEVRESLEESMKEAAESSLIENVWDAVLENSEVTEYPQDRVQKIIDQMNEQYQEMATYYNVEFEEFLTTYMGMDEETFNTEVENVAKEQMKEILVMELIAEEEKLTPSDEELEKKYEEYAEAYGFESVDALKEMVTEDDLKQMATLEVVQNWLVENCKQVEATEE